MLGETITVVGLGVNEVVSPKLRFMQVTPPGSACSIAFGIGLLRDPGLQVVVVDADAAHDDLEARGVREPRSPSSD